MSDIRTVIVDNLDYCPTNFYIMTATGQYLFFRTKDRIAAQQEADKLYGKNFYTIRTTDLSNKTKKKYQLIEDMEAAQRQEEDSD